MERILSIVLAAALLVCFAPSASADTPLEERLAQGWRWRELPRSGLGANIVHFAPAAQRGLLAFAGDRLVLFDGYRWSPVREGLDLPTSPGRIVQSVPGGIVVHDGAQVLSYDLDGKRRVLFEDGNVDLPPGRDFWTIGARGLLVVDGRLMRAELDGLVDLAPSPPEVFIAGDVDAQGRIWVSTRKGAYVFERKAWRRLRTDIEGRPHTSFRHVRCLGDETWFLPSPASGHNFVLRVEPDAGAARLVKEISGPVWSAQVVPGQGLICAAGAFALQVRRDGRWTTIELPVAKREQIRGLTLLPSGLLACRTVTGRVYTCDLRSERWRRFMPPSEATYSNVLHVEPARAGGFWVATSQGVHRFQEGRFKESFQRVLDQELRVITTAHEDDHGHLWIGSGSEFSGALRFDGERWHRHTEEDGAGNYCVHAIRRGPAGGIWLLLLSPPGERAGGGGAARWKDGGWRRFTTADGLPGPRCYDLAVTGSGRTYLATSRGLARLEGERFVAVDGLTGFPVKRLLAASDGSLWVAQGAEPGRTIEDGPQTIRVKQLVDFSASADFAEGRDDRVWYAAQGGLYLFDGTHEHEVTREPGAPARSFWPVHRDGGGALWIGGSGAGLIRFTPDDRDAPRVHEVEVLRGEARSSATVRWHATDRWSVTPQDALLHQWRLDGGAWSEPSRQPEVVLAGLDSGEHRFDVRSFDLLGNVSENAPTATFVIEAPWYARADFLVPLLLGFAALVAGLVLSARHRRREQEARETAARYARELLQRANVLLASLGEDGELLYIGPGFFRDFSPYRFDAVKADPELLLERVHPDDVEGALTFTRTRGGLGTKAGEFRLKHQGGGYRWILVSATPRDPAGSTGGGWDFVGADITDVKRAQSERTKMERQIQHTQKLESLGVLAGGIAHDFNNLLTGILAHANMALTSLGAESPLAPHMRGIETAAVRAAGLTQQMLAYSGKGRFVVEPIDLTVLVKEMTYLLEASISKRATLRYDLAENLPAVMADATQVRQVVMNLITNASDALHASPGILSITTGVQQADDTYLAQTYFGSEVPPGRYVFVEVSDTGIGMDAETQAKLFDPFFTTKATGRGLGLSAVLGIVRGHKGTLKLYSEVGKGTSVKVLFPASEESIEPEREDPTIASWRAEGTVLVVDDEEGVRLVLETVLGTAGFDVLTANDGADGLKAFKEHEDEIVLVLLDMTMPRMDGEAAFRELRQLKPDVRAILMSGYNAQDATSRFAGKGLAGFIQKPFRPAELVQKIKEAMTRRPSIGG
ncbi:MAG: response regulator [Planctomycetota bacterium]|nr:response regulator [Planctomycetota bacterium]